MRIKQILVAFLFTALVISCGNKAKDINVSELKTECEVVDAILLVANEIIALGEAVDSEEGASEAQKKEYKSLKEIVGEISELARGQDFDESKAEACPNFETLEAIKTKGRRLEKVFR